MKGGGGIDVLSQCRGSISKVMQNCETATHAKMHDILHQICTTLSEILKQSKYTKYTGLVSTSDIYKVQI